MTLQPPYTKQNQRLLKYLNIILDMSYSSIEIQQDIFDLLPRKPQHLISLSQKWLICFARHMTFIINQF